MSSYRREYIVEATPEPEAGLHGYELHGFTLTG